MFRKEISSISLKETEITAKSLCTAKSFGKGYLFPIEFKTSTYKYDMFAHTHLELFI